MALNKFSTDFSTIVENLALVFDPGLQKLQYNIILVFGFQTKNEIFFQGALEIESNPKQKLSSRVEIEYHPAVEVKGPAEIFPLQSPYPLKMHGKPHEKQLKTKSVGSNGFGKSCLDES